MRHCICIIIGLIIGLGIWFLKWWFTDKIAAEELAKLKAEELAKLKAENKLNEVINETIKKPLPTTKSGKLDRFKQLMRKSE